MAVEFVLDGYPYAVVEAQFVKPGKGQAFTRTKLKNMITGAVLERTFKSGEKLEKADMEERQMQYLYPEGDQFVFMDTSNYNQLNFRRDQLGDTPDYLQDGMMVDVLFWSEKPIGVTPPIFVELEVVETEPSMKGATASASYKPAKMETGLVVMVPPFIEPGTRIIIDTRENKYLSRA